MTNLYRQNKRGTPLLSVCIAVVVLIAVVFAIDRFGGGVVREYARGAGGAARALLVSAAVSIRESGALSSKSSLAHENEQLRREIALHAEEVTLAGYLRDENAQLQQMAQLAGRESGTTAHVLSSLKSSPYGTFLIDVGANDGVQEGSLVLTEGGFVLGAVTTVGRESATIQALFAPGTTNDLLVSETVFAAEGRGGGNARAEVPRGSLVAVGDIISAPAFGGRPAGAIVHIESASSSAIAILSIRVPVNLDTLRFVYVVPH